MSQSRPLLTDDPLWVTHLLQTSLDQGISDVHIEPKPHHALVRQRIEGLLQTCLTLNTWHYLQLLNRIKMLSELDLAEHRLPQEGQFSLTFKEKNYPIRVSIFPTLFGEKISLRILHSTAIKQHLHELGFTPSQLQAYVSALNAPQGLILITGPTGSGKTSTLHTSLNYYDPEKTNIVTLEDPIEHINEAFTQTAIQPTIGFNYAMAFKALLRQDPDIIMIGEIRDPVLAKLCIEAAQTGHLVFATLHCGTALGVIERLKSLNLSLLDITQNLKIILAQRLVRLVCTHCQCCPATKTPPSECPNCHHGYRYRHALFEMLSMSAPLKRALNEANNPVLLQQALQLQKFQSLWAQGEQLVRKQLTTFDELQRIIPHDPQFF